MVADIFLQDEITFKADTHQYFNRQGVEYTSVSRLLDTIKVPFDRNGVSLNMARQVAESTGISVGQAQREILSEWDAKRDSSIDKGNFVHGGLEEYVLTGKVDPKLDIPIKYMQGVFKDYYRFYPEVMLYSHDYGVCGTTDLVLQRQKNKKPVMDFRDYKTNESKGIYFDSIKRKDGVKHYNRYYLPPFDHMEDCNYNQYALQLSIYAFLALSRLDIRVGNLGLIYFDNWLKPHYYPVPFMYHEAKWLCETNLVRKKLPEPVKEKPVVVFDPNNVEEDW